MNKILEIINDEMISIVDEYYYLTNDREKVIYPYFTGEYFESGYTYENGVTTGQLLLEGWTRGSNAELNEIVSKIKSHFAHLQIVKDEIAIAFECGSISPQRADDPELKKIEIYIDITYWKGK